MRPKRKSAKKDAKKYFSKEKDRIASTQIQMIVEALDLLFARSPHFGGQNSKHAQGEYDANHKIRINGGETSPHFSPTNSRALSQALIDREKDRAQNIQCGDRVEIFNTTAHAKDVEYGVGVAGSTWRKDGYHVYEDTMEEIKERYRSVAK